MRPTLQEAFDKVWKWFVVDKHGPSYRDGQCSYRGDRGKKCAIGLLLPDTCHFSAFEGDNIIAVVETYPEVLRFLPRVSTGVLKDLQSCHDSAALEFSNSNKPFRKGVTDRLRAFAKQHRLTVPTAD